MKEIDKIINQDETVLWEGGPVFLPFLISRYLNGLVVSFGSLFIFLGIVGTWGYLGWLDGNVELGKIYFLYPIIVITICTLIGSLIYHYLSFKRTYYAITDKRVMLQSGIIGRDFKILDFDKITDAEVNVGLFDKLFSSDCGSISVASGLPNYYLKSIPKPYEVFKFFKKTSYDVKTDVAYPNAYRPDTNPGYTTKYNPPGFKKNN